MLLPVIKNLLPRRSRLSILDVGCGTGVITSALAEQGHELTGIDVAEDGIAIARQSVPAARFFVLGAYDDWLSLAPEGGWDVIIAVEVIEHLYAPQRFLQNCFARTRKGGCVIVTTPYHGYLKNLAISFVGGWDKHFTVHHEGGHIKFFSRQTLSAAVRSCGFDGVVFECCGRVPGLWKSMVCRARRP